MYDLMLSGERLRSIQYSLPTSEDKSLFHNVKLFGQPPEVASKAESLPK